MAFYATEYTIHFDDTMAYGGHHFLTAFKFQCAARESFMFGEHIFDVAGVQEALAGVHLLTSDAYSRNLSPTQLGDRVAILLTLEDWGRVSARFCYRVIDAQGRRVCAGFQTLICADAATGEPIPLPPPLRNAMDAVREVEELRPVGESFRDCVLAGGAKLDSLFGEAEQTVAANFLSDRYPAPRVISATKLSSGQSSELSDVPRLFANGVSQSSVSGDGERQAWVFAGQGAFDAELFCERVVTYSRSGADASGELEQGVAAAFEMIGGDAHALISGDVDRVREATKETPGLLQVAIHLQNVLGGLLWQQRGHQPSVLIGHSFGEIAAFGVGGCFDLPTGVRVVCMRTNAIAEHAPNDGGLMVVASSRHQVETEVSLLGLDSVRIAGRNHDKQTVATGPIEQLDLLQEYFQGAGVGSASIPSPTSFHHPELRLAASHWLDQLRGLSFQRPTQTIYSPIGRRYLDKQDDMAAILASQLLQPFDLQGAIADVVATGVTLFVDCGSKGSLARLVSKACMDEVPVCGVETEGTVETRKNGQPFDEQMATLTPMKRRFEAKRDSVASNGVSHASKTSPAELRPSSKSDVSAEASASKTTVPSIAIVGQGCILPGGATSPEQLYAAIEEQRLGIVDQRGYDSDWSEDFYSEKLVADRSTSHLAGRVNDSDIVVPDGVDPIVFDGFTRTQRLLCIALAPCVASLTDAGRVICLIGATADGFEDQDEVSSLVFAGIDPTDNAVDQRMNTARSAFKTPHEAVQEVFDKIVRPGLKVTLVDAACASSLYTMALGMQALETDRADAVIAGGVFCPGPGNSCLFSQFHGTTSTGCRPFDAGADGVVFSEGAALVTLRRHSDANRLELDVEATVRGAGLSSDGRSPSANVPQSNGQIISLQRCYENYRIDPASIQAIEGHGTSTSVGDSTELETLRNYFQEHTSKPIPVHSLKGALGHAGWAAGTASVIAACEYLRRDTFPAQAFHREPSDALTKYRATLTVPTQPVSLQRQQRRVAIDGFGFGGANAHVVMEKTSGDQPGREWIDLRSRPSDRDQELVVVAHHQVKPTKQSSNGFLFDPAAITLPKGCLVLPELVDDMDISQTLAVILSKNVIDQLPGFDDALRRDTSLVLAMRGKTERGIEATARIMTQRIRRKLQGIDHVQAALDSVQNRSRPSGSYTLQCMMPNVATGRAALLMNLNGPNFVVDSGLDSVSEAFESAALLLRSGENGGAKVAIVAAINARTLDDHNARQTLELGACAAAFGVTTRRFAESKGWDVVALVDDALGRLCDTRGSETKAPSMRKQVQVVVDSMSGASAHEREKPSSPKSAFAVADCKIHHPVWVERAASSDSLNATKLTDSMLAVAPANANMVAELMAALPEFSRQFAIAVVGDAASEIASGFEDPRVFPVDLADESTASSAFQMVDELNADLIVAFDVAESWDLLESMSNVSTDNSLCEWMFLVSKRNIKRIAKGHVELWGVFLDAWDLGLGSDSTRNGTAHPCSGAVAGLLKSVRREHPDSRSGTICTRGIGVSQAIARLFVERSQADIEVETAHEEGVRYVRRLRPVTNLPDPIEQVKLESESVVVATGGARGVTSVMLDAIMRDHHCTVIAFGRSVLEAGPADCNDASIQQDFYRQYLSDHPGASAKDMNRSFDSARARWEAHRTIENLKEIGGRVEYMAVDVTDSMQVAQALDQIKSRYGRIDLLIHGAGVQLSKRLEDRTLDEFRRTYRVKVLGLRNVVQGWQSLSGKTISAHVLTSAYSVFGNDGQHDYGAANETMDRICDISRIAESHRWSSIAWLAWDGVGMTRGSEYRALAKQRGLSGVTPETGQRLFRDVMSGRTGAAINVPVSEAEHVKYEIATVPARISELATRRVEVLVDLDSVECLPFHRVRDTPTLPGAWILERLVHAGLKLCPNPGGIKDVTVDDASFQRFVRQVDGVDPKLRVVAEKSNDKIDVWMLKDVVHPSGHVLAKDVICATARLQFNSSRSAPDSRIEVPSYGGKETRSVEDPYCQGESGEVDLSGPFNCLSPIEIGIDSRRAMIAPAASFPWDCEIPALLLDAAWRVAAVHALSPENDLFVPVHIHRMIIPVGRETSADAMTGWEVRSTTPKAEGQDVRWERTEVIDANGVLRLLVENGFAKRLS